MLNEQYLNGGAKGDRTPDLLRAKQALSQLSYNPIYMVGLNGLEPSTSRLSGVRSNQLSYRPSSLWTTLLLVPLTVNSLALRHNSSPKKSRLFRFFTFQFKQILSFST